MALSPRLGASALALLVAAPALAQDRAVSYTYYGTPGLLEMPSAISADDGEIAGTVSYFGGQLRNNLTFQITPKLSGTFRYTRLADFYPTDERDFYDRSFDLRFRFNDEGAYMPMVAVGLQDFLGTGLYSGEYLVATKTVGDAFRVTGGLGWGRFGSYNGFANPLGVFGDRFDTRPTTFEAGDPGGSLGYEAFFRGDAALFGGVEWAPNERWLVKAEYSSDDAYNDVNGNPLFERDSPFNFGVTWRPLPGLQLNLGYLYGSQLAFSGTVALNPNSRPFGAGFDAPPPPVAVRAQGLEAAASWDRAAAPAGEVAERLRAALRAEGISLDAIELGERTARLRYTNDRYRAEAQGLGRVARVLSRELPPSIETFVLEPQRNGVPLSAVTLSRSDLERYENEVGGSAALLRQAQFDAAGSSEGLLVLPSARSRFSWDLSPYFSFGFFDPRQPVQLNFGAELSASYRIRPDLVLSGSIRQRILPFGERDPGEIIVDDDWPVVRRNGRQYGASGGPVLQNLTLAQYGRLAPDVYGRLTVGYLERMYGGLSGEVLWKPVESPLALGLEVDYVRQRDFEQPFGFRDYDVVTGHASVYYDFRNGFVGQIDAGRYLAGDWGATFALDREFENGWKVGAYFTLTDMSFEDYGEGSFDKGIRLSVPIDYLLGRPTRSEITGALASLNRDGGERVRVQGRLYDVVRQGQYSELEDSWGRFWR